MHLTGYYFLNGIAIIVYQTTQLSKFIEPAIIVILGFVVGIVLIAMYLPMFNMGNTIG